MRRAVSVLLCVVVALVFVAGLQAEGKQVTLKGLITCAKCDLKKAKKCETVIVVNKDGKEVIYYFDRKSHRAHHRKVCRAGKEGTVVAKCQKKGDRFVLSVSKVEFE